MRTRQLRFSLLRQRGREEDILAFLDGEEIWSATFAGIVYVKDGQIWQDGVTISYTLEQLEELQQEFFDQEGVEYMVRSRSGGRRWLERSDQKPRSRRVLPRRRQFSDGDPYTKQSLEEALEHLRVAASQIQYVSGVYSEAGKEYDSSDLAEYAEEILNIRTQISSFQS